MNTPFVQDGTREEADSRVDAWSVKASSAPSIAASCIMDLLEAAVLTLVREEAIVRAVTRRKYRIPLVNPPVVEVRT